MANTYHAFYMGSKIELEAENLFAARKAAAAEFQSKSRRKLNPGLLAIVLVGKDGEPVQFSPSSL